MTEDSEPKAGKAQMIIAGVILLVMAGVLCLYQLRVTHVAIVTTLGKPKVVTKPGLHVRLPWPVQQVTRLDKRLQCLELTAKEINTKDSINVVSRFFALWSVADPQAFFNRYGTLLEAEAQMRPLIEAQQETSIRQYTLTELLTDAKEIEAAMLEATQKAVAAYGITVSLVGLQEVSLSEDSTAGVFARMRQEQQTLAHAIRAEGEKEAKIMRDNAASQKAQKLALAEAEAKEIRGNAVIAAASLYPAFEEDLEFAIFLRKMDALVEMMSTKTTIVLDPDTPPFDLLELKPMKQTARP